MKECWHMISENVDVESIQQSADEVLKESDFSDSPSSVSFSTKSSGSRVWTRWTRSRRQGSKVYETRQRSYRRSDSESQRSHITISTTHRPRRSSQNTARGRNVGRNTDPESSNDYTEHSPSRPEHRSTSSNIRPPSGSRMNQSMRPNVVVDYGNRAVPRHASLSQTRARQSDTRSDYISKTESHQADHRCGMPRENQLYFDHQEQTVSDPPRQSRRRPSSSRTTSRRPDSLTGDNESTRVSRRRERSASVASSRDTSPSRSSRDLGIGEEIRLLPELPVKDRRPPVSYYTAHGHYVSTRGNSRRRRRSSHSRDSEYTLTSNADEGEGGKRRRSHNLAGNRNILMSI